MHTRKINRIALTNRPSFEPLEDRQFCSTTTKTVVTPFADRLKSEAIAAGVNQAVLTAALKTASTGKASDQSQAERIIVAAGLGLPAEALKTNLFAKQLVQQTANLGLIGASAQASTPGYWNTVKTKGADVALAGEVRASLAIPESSTKGKSAKQLLSDAANISLLTGDPSSPKAWAGLALLKQGKITVEQFAANYANGGDLSKEAKALGQKLRASVTRANARTTRATSSPASNGYNPATDVSTNKDYGTSGVPYAQPTPTTDQAAAGSGTDGTSAEYTINTITHNSDGTTTVNWTMSANGQSTSYTTTYYPADETGPGSYDVYDSSGAYVGGGTGTPPKDSTAGKTTQSTNGDQAIFPGDSAGNNNGDGSNDNQKDGDKKPADPPPAADATTPPDDGTTPAAPPASSTPNPDNDTSSAQARQEWLSSTPFGQGEMNSILNVLGVTRGGGVNDPTDPGVNQHARAAFCTSALFSKSPLTIDDEPGNIDYVDTVSQFIVIDKQQLTAIAIKAGAAVDGPGTGKGTTVPPPNPVIPKAPVTGGGTTAAVFSTTAITAKVATNIVASSATAKVAASVVK